MSELKEAAEAKVEVKEVKRSEPIPPPPEGMSKSAWKKELKKRKWEEQKEEVQQKRKEKRQRIKQLKKEKRDSGELQPKPRKPAGQTKSDVTVVVDCAFDDLMKDTERGSLATQIVRCYSDNRHAMKKVQLKVTSFNKQLRERFDSTMQSQYKRWEDFEYSDEDFTPNENYFYLSSDSDHVISELEEGKTYVIGGIVDKGRYKNLCKDKAEKMGIKTGRLPIDEYIKLSGRRVLTTNHVLEILLKKLEGQSWKDAFESVLPTRKLIEKQNQTSQTGEAENGGNGEIGENEEKDIESKDGENDEKDSEAKE